MSGRRACGARRMTGRELQRLAGLLRWSCTSFSTELILPCTYRHRMCRPAEPVSGEEPLQPPDDWREPDVGDSDWLDGSSEDMGDNGYVSEDALTGSVEEKVSHAPCLVAEHF